MYKKVLNAFALDLLPSLQLPPRVNYIFLHILKKPINKTTT